MCGQAETDGSSRLSIEGDHVEYRFLEYDVEQSVMYVLRVYAAHLSKYTESDLLQRLSPLCLNLCIPHEEVTNLYAELCRMLTHAEVSTVFIMKCDRIFLGCLQNEMVFCIMVEDTDTKDQRKHGFLSLSSPYCHMR